MTDFIFSDLLSKLLFKLSCFKLNVAAGCSTTADSSDDDSTTVFGVFFNSFIRVITGLPKSLCPPPALSAEYNQI
jgi:hypothetical protein